MSTPFVHLHSVDRNNFIFTLYGTYTKLTKLYTVKYISLNYFYMILLMTKIQFVLLNCKCVNHQTVNDKQPASVTGTMTEYRLDSRYVDI